MTRRILALLLRGPTRVPFRGAHPPRVWLDAPRVRRRAQGRRGGHRSFPRGRGKPHARRVRSPAQLVFSVLMGFPLLCPFACRRGFLWPGLRPRCEPSPDGRKGNNRTDCGCSPEKPGSTARGSIPVGPRRSLFDSSAVSSRWSRRMRVRFLSCILMPCRFRRLVQRHLCVSPLRHQPQTKGHV